MRGYRTITGCLHPLPGRRGTRLWHAFHTEPWKKVENPESGRRATQPGGVAERTHPSGGEFLLPRARFRRKGVARGSTGVVAPWEELSCVGSCRSARS